MIGLKMNKLTYVKVNGLLGEYDHSFAFEKDNDIVILYGPNGVGKTHVLELICYSLQAEWVQLQNMPFSSAELEFEDGAKVGLSFEIPDVEVFPNINQRRTGRRALNDDPQLKITLTREGESEHYFPPMIELDQFSPSVIRRAIVELGIGGMEGDRYPNYNFRTLISELSASDARRIKLFVSNQFQDESGQMGRFAAWMEEEFFESSNATLIETQRLLGQLRNRTSNSGEVGAPRMLAIQEVSQSVQLLMDAALAKNSRISQQLDRTFPERILNSDGGVSQSAEWIRSTHTAQLNIRERLAEYHLATEDSARVELPNRELSKWERSFLGQYLLDSKEKLDSFTLLLQKLDFFIMTLNERFTNKRIYFTQDRSLELVNSVGKTLKVEDLSSGEQHEIILLKYLLFDASPESLVLIDEPEISLHVSWQKAFLDDLRSVASISRIRFIVATHSPQIINNSWELTRPLGVFS